jgi:hypothetical protein
MDEPLKDTLERIFYFNLLLKCTSNPPFPI